MCGSPVHGPRDDLPRSPIDVDPDGDVGVVLSIPLGLVHTNHADREAQVELSTAQARAFRNRLVDVIEGVTGERWFR